MTDETKRPEMDDEDLWNEVDREEGDAEADEAADAEPEAEPEQETEQAPGEIDWSSVPEAIKAAYEAEAEKARRAAGHQSVLQRRLNELEAQRAKPKEPEQPKTEEVDDEFSRLQEEYPEIAGPLLKQVSKLNETIGQQRQVLDQLMADRDSRERATLQATDAELLSERPDFYETLRGNADKFRDWIDNDAPVRFSRVVRDNEKGIKDVQASVEVYDAFLRHLGKEPAPQMSSRRQRQLASTAAPRTKGPSAVSGIPADGDPQALWDAIDV